MQNKSQIIDDVLYYISMDRIDLKIVCELGLPPGL